jgi:hypothetical protein
VGCAGAAVGCAGGCAAGVQAATSRANTINTDNSDHNLRVCNIFLLLKRMSEMVMYNLSLRQNDQSVDQQSPPFGEINTSGVSHPIGWRSAHG